MGIMARPTKMTSCVLQGSAAWVIFRRPQLNPDSVLAAEVFGILIGNSSGEWEWAEEKEPEENALSEDWLGCPAAI